MAFLQQFPYFVNPATKIVASCNGGKQWAIPGPKEQGVNDGGIDLGIGELETNNKNTQESLDIEI